MKDKKVLHSKGYALITVLLLFTMLFIIIIGTIEITMSSLLQSQRIEKKAEMSYKAESALEMVLFYTEKAVSEAKRLTYNQFFDSNGNPLYQQPDFEQRYKETFYSYVLSFFGIPTGKTLSIMMNTLNGQQNVNSFSDVVSKVQQILSNTQITWNFNQETYSINLEVASYDNSSRVIRKLNCLSNIPSPFERIQYTQNQSSSSSDGWDSSIFNLSDYVVFTGGSFNSSNNSTILNQNIFSNSDFTLNQDSNKDDYSIWVRNMILKNGKLILSGKNKVRTDNLLYTKGGIIFNDQDNEILSKILYSDGDIIFNNRSSITTDELFSNGALKIENGSGNNVTINQFAYISTLSLGTDKLLLKQNSKLYASLFDIKNRGYFTAEVGTVVYANNLNISGSSAKFDAQNTTVFCNNLTLDGEVFLKAQKIYCSGTVTLRNIKNGNDINVTGKIECKNLPSNIPSNLQGIFIQNQNLNFQIQYPQTPEIVNQVRSNNFPTSYINLNNITETKRIYDDQNKIYILITQNSVNDNDEIFNKTSNNPHDTSQIYIISKGNINVPSSENNLRGALITNSGINFNGGNLFLEQYAFPQAALDYLASHNIITNAQPPPPPQPGVSVTITPSYSNIKVLSRHFIIK